MSEDKQKTALEARSSILELRNSQRVKELRRSFSAGANQDKADSRVKNSSSPTHEDILEELAKQKPLSASDSQIEVDQYGGSAKKEGKGKRLKKTYKKLKDEVFTPVMERARRVSRTISRPFGEEWSSDEQEDEHDDPLAFFQSLHRARKKGSIYSTDSEETDPSSKRYNSDEARFAAAENRGRRKSTAGFLVSYASHKLHKMASGSTEESQSDWIYVEDAEHFENPITGERFTPEKAHISDLHPRELDYLRSLSLDRFNEKDTGTTAAMPKDPGRKLKRSSSFRGKKSLEKENHKLLAGGIFEVPLQVVLQIDAINGCRQDPIIKCIRDKKRKNKEEPSSASVIRSLTPRLGRRFGSLKARSISPINLSPRYQNEAVDDSECLTVPNNLLARSFSTPSTPIDTRKMRPVNSASAIYNTDTPMITLNDLVNKLSNISVRDGSTSSLETEKNDYKLEVPQILQNCCEYILLNGLDQQGIFRVCGAKKQVRTLRAEFNTTSKMSIPSDTNVHVVAGLIKEFLKELPESLLTKTLYYPFIHCRRLEELDVRLEAYKELIRLLPRTSRDTLQFLLQFFKIVAENCEDRFDKDGLPIEGNLMDVSNLAVVIGPNILHRRKLGGNESKSQLANEAWEAPQVIEVVKELMENHKILFTVESEVRKDVLRLMHDMKQSHFDDVMNGYNGVEEDSRGHQSPDISIDSKAQSRTDLTGSNRQLMNGSSGFVSGGCSTNDSNESLQYKTCSTNRDQCMLGYCQRQHSSPELSTLNLGDSSHKRLSRSLDQTEDVSGSQRFQYAVEEPTTSSEEIVSKDSLYDLTPPSSPMFETSTQRTLLCKAKLGKSTSLTGYGALSPNQTFTQFRLDRMTVGGNSRAAVPASPRLGESRRAAMKKQGNNNSRPARKTYSDTDSISRQSEV